MSFYSIHDVDRHGINEVLHRALQEVDPTGKRPIHLSYDIDALDPTIAPSTGTPVFGGLSLREGLFIAEEIANTGRLSAMDLVEVNPVLGDETQQRNTIGMAMQIIEHAFGRKRQGMYPPGYSVPIPEPGIRKKPTVNPRELH